jgi:hypothetical protein
MLANEQKTKKEHVPHRMELFYFSKVRIIDSLSSWRGAIQILLAQPATTRSAW